MSIPYIRVQARSISTVGDVNTCDGWPIVRVPAGVQADILYREATKDYRKKNSRPWVVSRTGRGYATLANALRAYGLLSKGQA